MKLRKEYISFLKEHDADEFFIGRYKAMEGQIGKLIEELQIDIDPNQDVRTYLKNLDSKKDNPYLLELAREVENIFDNIKVKLKFKYYLGEFPTGEFNAVTVPVRRGYLFLFNTGLFKFLGVFTKLLSIDLERYLQKEDKLRRAEDIYDEKTVKSITELLISYIYGMNVSRMLADLQLSDPTITRDRFEILKYIELTILLHEFSHAVRGHLHSSQCIQYSSPGGKIEVMKHRWKNEFDADISTARLLLLNSYERSKGGRHFNVNTADMLFISVTFTFWIMDMIEEIGAHLRNEKTFFERVSHLIESDENGFSSMSDEFLQKLDKHVNPWELTHPPARLRHSCMLAVSQETFGIPYENHLQGTRSVMHGLDILKSRILDYVKSRRS